MSDRENNTSPDDVEQFVLDLGERLTGQPIRPTDARAVVEQPEWRLVKELPADSAAADPTAKTKVYELVPRSTEANLKLEQNFACEFPVCVANRRHIRREMMEIVSDDGERYYRIRRPAGENSFMPDPSHFRYFLWAIDAVKRMLDVEKMRVGIKINPMEIFDLFGTDGCGYWYEHLDEGFYRLAGLTGEQYKMLTMYEKPKKGARKTTPTRYLDATVFHLLEYHSWRRESQQQFEFEKGHFVPSEFLFSSVKNGYLKSIDINRIRRLSFPAQRFALYLEKHLQLGEQQAFYLNKLLPRIPLEVRSRDAERRLSGYHQELADAGYITNADFDGRGKNKMVVYTRPKPSKPTNESQS